MTIDLDSLDSLDVTSAAEEDLVALQSKLGTTLVTVSNEISRRRVEKARTFTEGMRVVATSKVKPGYLKGATGTVLSSAYGHWVRVRFGLKDNRLSNGNLWRRKWSSSGEMYIKSSYLEGIFNNALQRIEP